MHLMQVWHVEAEKFLESKGISKLSKNALDMFSKGSLPVSLDKPGQFSKVKRGEERNEKESCADEPLSLD